MPSCEPNESGLNGHQRSGDAINSCKNMILSPKMLKWNMNEDIVISGMAGRYPESDNIEEFAYNLYNNIDMVVEDERRWPYGFLGLPHGSGKIKDISRFDAKFFGVNDWEANYLDSQLRILLELTYEALWDSGTDPNSLSNTNTGVFVGNCFDEFTSAYAEDYTKIVGYKQFFASMVANKFNLSGPSKLVDTACASSFSALHEAVVSLRSNQCDRAIVAGLNLCLRAATQMQFYSLNMISPDGHCKCLDESANGYAKGEALVVMLLQRKSEAKRIYTTVIHSKTNSDGFKDLGITYPSWELQRNLIRDVYSESGVDPLSIKYCEAHCTGTQAGDPTEMRAICESLCIGRTDPLLIGALKSNIGHAEASSGLASLTKVILSFENKCIPANLHMSVPNSRIEGLVSGILKPITQNTPFDGGLVGLNCFGFGGVNVHVIVKSHDKKPAKDNLQIANGIPRLIQMCGRNEELLKYTFTFILSNPKKLTRDYLSLLNDISKTSPFRMNCGFKGMRYRGFTIIEDSLQNSIQSNDFEIKKTPKCEKKIWYVFSGMGSQWPAMGKSLLNIEIFAKSIKTCAKVLNDFNIDLISLLTENNQNVMQSPLYSFITIASIQIAFVDLLKELDIKADGIIGHSIGELVCAYADGCLSAEETILIAFWRGKCLQENNRTNGMMAAVGMTWDETQRRCSHNVFAACHNAEDSVTVSGDENAIQTFISKLIDENIFARKVDSSGIAFHSPLISSITEPLIEKLKHIIPSNRMRSSKWISSTYSESEWHSHKAKYASPEYFVDNLILPALFYDGLKHIPKNAIVIEISPHHLLQPIIKRNLGLDITYIPLMKKNGNNLKLLLSSIGHLYTLGFNTKIEKLYPKVSYPVSGGTHLISPIIKWDHKKKYTTTQYPDFFNPIGRNDYIVKVDLQEKEDSYLADHCVDGRVLFPATGYLFLAWKQLAKEYGVTYDKLAVEFENVSLLRATLLPKSGITKFNVRVFKVSGNFVIAESGTIAATGRVFVPEDDHTSRFAHILNEDVSDQSLESETITLRTKDIYKELRLRGYDYGPNFQCISKSFGDKQKLKASIKWNNNWITFADCMIQMAILGKTSRELYLPVRIDSLRCDPRILFTEAMALGEEPQLNAVFDYHLNIGVSKGLEFRGIKANLAPRKLNSQIPIVEKFQFVAHNEVYVREDEQQFIQYKDICDIQALKVAQKFELKSENFLTLNENKKHLLNKSGDSDENKDMNEFENKSLYEFLNKMIEIQEMNGKSFKEELISKLSTIENDLITESFNNEYFLRSQLETVMENITANKINVLEVNQSSVIMSSNVINWLTLSSFNMKINYALLHPFINELPLDSISNLQTYDWLIQKSKLPPEINNLDLVILKDSSICQLSSHFSVNLTQLFESIWSAIKENGFLLIVCKDKVSFAEEVICKVLDLSFCISRKKDIVEEAQRVGFTLIGTKTDLFSNTALLLHKVSVDIQLDKQIFIQISDQFETWIEKLQNELKSIHEKPEGENIWLIADNPSDGIIGFVSCLRKELNGNRIRCVLDFDRHQNNIFDCNNTYSQIILKQNLVMNVIRNQKLGSFKHFTIGTHVKPVSTEHCLLNVITKGDLSSFRWFESQHKFWPLGRKDNQLLCYVYYSALNFRDIMVATGKLPPDALPEDVSKEDCILGFEFSGRDENGNRVMGMIPSKALATTVVVDDIDFLWPIPSHWSLEESATIPVVYGTAFYALIIRGKLKRGETVLIHSGSGGVGQAAIAICLSLECQLFITVGSKEKREFLKKEFPKLCDQNFSSSRDISFETKIMKETDGRGVDVVLNSLSEEKLEASLRCLATNGRFLEIGKFDFSQNNNLNLSHLLRNKTFHAILLDTLLVLGPNITPVLARHRKLIWHLVKEGIVSGTVRPLKRTIFGSDKCEEAFRFMANGKHIGKVLIKIRDENEDFSTNSLKMLAIPRTVFKDNKSYIITGGLGGFGLELVNWMVERGAKKFVLTSRTGPKEPYQHFRLKYFSDIGIKVLISTKDVSTLKGTEELIEEASALAPVGGIFHLSMVLSDGLFENQTIDSFRNVCAPKSTSILNLDSVSRKYCKQIDYFVAFSSVSCGVGNPGQSNYGFANSVMERVCDLRRDEGLHGFAIQWGAIGDVGYVIDNMGGNDVVICGSLPQRIPSCLASLDRLLQSDHSVCSSIIKADLQFDSSGSKKNLMKSVAHILGVKDYTLLDSNTTLGELGMDSLMGVEVKQTLERDYDLVMSMQDIRKLSIAKIQEINAGNQSSVKSDNSIENKQMSDNESVIQIPTESVTYLNDIINGDPIIFMPPVDGTYVLLKPIAKSLNRPAVGLNWTLDCKDFKTIEETATHFLNVINKEFPNISTNYDLIGYSYGGIVAFEMGIQLQKRSKNIRKLILLDSSPPQFKSDTEEVVRFHKLCDQESGQIEALVSFLMDNVSVDYQKVKSLLQNSSKEERTQKVSQIFLESAGIECDPQTIAFAADSHSNKLFMLNTYSTQDIKFNGNVLLLRANEHVVNQNHTNHVIKHDYGLNEIITGKCDVQVLNGDHKTFMTNNLNEVCNSINKYLNVD